MEAPTYEESAMAMTNQSRALLLQQAGDDWRKAKSKANQAASCELEAINLLRSCGDKLREAADHDLVPLAFWQAHSAELPPDLTYSATRFCVSLAREFTKPIESLEECRAARQKLFQAFQQEAAHRRLRQQTARERNPWSDLVSGASSLTRLFQDLEAEAMEGWSKDKLTLFVRSTEPIAKQHQKALELLSK